MFSNYFWKFGERNSLLFFLIVKVRGTLTNNWWFSVHSCVNSLQNFQRKSTCPRYFWKWNKTIWKHESKNYGECNKVLVVFIDLENPQVFDPRDELPCELINTSTCKSAVQFRLRCASLPVACWKLINWRKFRFDDMHNFDFRSEQSDINVNFVFPVRWFARYCDQWSTFENVICKRRSRRAVRRKFKALKWILRDILNCI